ncbi:MAG: hypothetical protein JXB03_03875 [Spirochaetales bacterium]|nr:hypothetical protein [Spirochaetales bacterium]
MNQHYMTLTLGRDLCYAGVKASAMADLEFYVKDRAIAIDGDDSVVFYAVHDGDPVPVSVGIALEEPARIADLPSIEAGNPGDTPGAFRLPPGKYGFVQLSSDADAVINQERKNLLEYMDDKHMNGDPEGFYLRSLMEDGNITYQILIPVIGVI